MPVKTKKFDAEVGKVLHLVINSIYTNKDIFLRELISNASDACDKLRYQSLKDSGLISKDHQFKITVNVDKKNKTIAVADTGIGMNEDDLVQHLGTIANSGTQKFVEQLSGNKKSDMQLIGQFGVGFYAAFMVADKVDVISKKAADNKVYKWSSDGKGEYSVEAVKEAGHVGTKILLHIKDSEAEFLEKFRLKHIITTYSDHISFPVELVDAEEKDKAEVVNKVSALWQRSPKDISEKEYEEFYSHVSHLPGKPWLTIHNKIEFLYSSYIFINVLLLSHGLYFSKI